MSSTICRRLHRRCASRHHGEPGVLKDRKNVYNYVPRSLLMASKRLEDKAVIYKSIARPELPGTLTTNNYLLLLLLLFKNGSAMDRTNV